MKIRFLSALICVAFLLTLLSGCVEVDKQNESSQMPSQGEQSLSDESSGKSESDGSPSVETESNPPQEPSEPPEAEEPDFFTKYGQGNIPEPSEIPDYCIETDEKYLYECQLPLPSADGVSTYASNGVLLLFYWEGDYQYCDMISLETGGFIKRISVPGTCQWGQFENGGFWTADRNTLEVKFYDTQGNETVMKQGGENTDERYPTALYVTDDGKYFITGYPRGTRGEIYCFETGNTIDPQVPANVEPWDIYETSRGIYFSGTVGMSYVYNIETEESQIVKSETSVGSFYGDICEILSDGYINLSSVYGDGEQFYVSANNHSYLQDLKYGCAVIPDSYTNDITFSDLRRGVSIQVSPAEEDAYGVFATLLENGTALIIAFSDNGKYVYIYDLASALRDKDKTFESETVIATDAELEQMIWALTESVYAEHGVELLCGSEGNDFNIYDYVGVAELDLYKVYNAANTVKAILDNYPKGMLKEAYSETNKGLKLYLCGDIYGIQSSSLDAAGGVTAESNGYIVVALDINDNLWSVVPHELSHVFDNRIQQVSDDGETNWIYLWEAATPFENAYTYSYDSYYENNDFTVYGEDDPENVWFTEDYARTFPTEDRACIMEDLFMWTSDGADTDIYEYENLLNKARLYSYILRQCFPSCNTSDINYWETDLGVIDSSVVPDVSNPVPVG